MPRIKKKFKINKNQIIYIKKFAWNIYGGYE